MKRINLKFSQELTCRQWTESSSIIFYFVALLWDISSFLTPTFLLLQQYPVKHPEMIMGLCACLFYLDLTRFSTELGFINCNRSSSIFHDVFTSWYFIMLYHDESAEQLHSIVPWSLGNFNKLQGCVLQWDLWLTTKLINLCLFIKIW